MPAKKLTPSQMADAARLKTAFRAWQNAQRDKGTPVSQLEAAGRLGFGQSALSQYLTGKIPLNEPVLWRFCELLGVEPEQISSDIASQAIEQSQRWAPTAVALERMAVEIFNMHGIGAAPLEACSNTASEVPEWLRQPSEGVSYTPDIELLFPDGSKAWVEVKSAHTMSKNTEHLIRLQARHPDDFLLLMADPSELPRVIDEWLARRGRDPQTEEDTPPRHRLRNRRPVWVVGRTQGGMPERVWGDGDYPAGATDEYADVSTIDQHAFACRVIGDSMVPRYMPGEYALVEPSIPPEVEDDVLVRLATGETLLKRLLSRRSGVRLGSYNSPEVHSLREDEISWMYYVAHPIPARRIKHHVETATYSGPERRSHRKAVDIERRRAMKE